MPKLDLSVLTAEMMGFDMAEDRVPCEEAGCGGCNAVHLRVADWSRLWLGSANFRSAERGEGCS